MPDPAPTILLTRPRAQSLRFAEGLTGAKLVISPVLEIVHLPFATDVRTYDGLIFTSENGIRAAAANSDLKGLTGYAVGERTADVGAEFGMTLRAAAGSADDLVASILADRPIGPLLHLHGAHSRGDVARRLKSAEIETDSVVVYDQKACPLSAEALAILDETGVVIVPLFSPRTAALLGQMCQGARAGLVLIGISATALQAWTGPKPLRQAVARAPTADAMRQEILRHIR